MSTINDPIKAACKILWDVDHTNAIITVKFGRLWEALKKAIYILLGVGATALVEIAAIAESLAAGVVSSIMSTAAAAVGKVFERIFKYLFTIFAAGPDAAFSLARLPLYRAREHSRREGLFLQDAAAALQVCISILSKWTEGFDNTRFYRQMKAAMAPILIAIESLNRVVTALDNTSFDEGSYRNAMLALERAIELTIPISKLDEQFGFTQRIQALSQQLLAQKLAKLANEKSIKLQAIDDRYRAETASYYKLQSDVQAQRDADLQRRLQNNTRPGGHSGDVVPAFTLGDPIEKKYKDTEGAAGVDDDARNLGAGIVNGIKKDAEAANLLIRAEASWYRDKQKLDIEYDKKEVVAKAETDAEARSYSVLSDIAGDVGAQFMADMRMLKLSAMKLLNSLKDAFIEYKLSQTYTQATYSSLERVKRLVQLLLQLTSNYSQGSSTAKRVVEAARNVVNGVYDDFDKLTKSFEKQLETATAADSATLSAQLYYGHVQLVAAQSLLNATITQSLINLLNLDELLGAELDAFKAFQARVRDIPDWSGNKNVWGVDPENLFNTGKYLTVIGDMVKLLGTMTASVTGTATDRSNNLKALSDVNSSMSDLVNHNAVVTSVLFSWEPPMNSDCEELNRIINAASDTVATMLLALDAVGMVTQLAAGIYDYATFADRNCKKYYDQFTKEGAPVRPTDEQVAVAVETLRQSELANSTYNNLLPDRAYANAAHRTSVQKILVLDIGAQFKNKEQVDSSKQGLPIPKPASNWEKGYPLNQALQNDK